MQTVIRVVAAGLCLFCLTTAPAAAQTMKAPARDHAISIDSAKALIGNFRKDSASVRLNGGMFNRSIIDTILASKGCIGLRFYYAKNTDGSPTLVLIGVDTLGRDMLGATVAERAYPCPPYCDDAIMLTK